MADRIKGITIEIGGDTTQLSKALSGINKEISSTQSQLKDVERLLKMDPGNITLLEQKQRLLSDAIEKTSQKLDQLKDAENQVQEQFKRGDVSQAQYDALQREIVSTESKLKGLADEAGKVDKKLNGVDEKPVEDVDKAADDAADSLEKAGKEASTFGSVLKADLVVTGLQALGSAINDVMEETKEYRKIMASLEVSSEAAGYTADETAQTYKQLFGVLADDQTAATTTANLQALGLSQKDLTDLTNGTIGAWATYGDSIPIDSLSEAINETIRVGTVTGTFADVLNWAGTSEDEFNAKLEAANSESERANLVLQELANQGLMDAGKAWQENNKYLVESNQAQADFQASLATMAERIEPITVAVQQGFNAIFQELLNLTEGIDFAGFVEGTVSIQEFTQQILDAVINIATSIFEQIPNLISAGAEIIGGIVQGIASRLPELVNSGAEMLEQISSGIGNNISEIATKALEVIEQFTSGLLENYPKIIEKGKEIISNLVSGFGNALPEIISKAAETVETLVNALADNLPSILEAGVEMIMTIAQGIVDSLPEIVDAITELVSTVLSTIAENLPEILEAGIEMVANLISGISEMLPDVVGAAAELAGNVVQAILDVDWIGLGADMIQGVISGIGSMAGALWDAAVGVAESALNAAKGWLGISSPSKVMRDEVGKWIPAGIAEGIENNVTPINRAAQDIQSSLTSNIGLLSYPYSYYSSYNNSVGGGSVTNTTTNLGGLSVNVYGAQGQDVNQLADIVMDKIESAYQSKGAVFGVT